MSRLRVPLEAAASRLAGRALGALRGAMCPPRCDGGEPCTDAACDDGDGCTDDVGCDDDEFDPLPPLVFCEGPAEDCTPFDGDNSAEDEARAELELAERWE